MKRKTVFDYFAKNTLAGTKFRQMKVTTDNRASATILASAPVFILIISISSLKLKLKILMIWQ
jgi:hypothetical protein